MAKLKDILSEAEPPKQKPPSGGGDTPEKPQKLKINNIFYKDESKRFHLKSFKALGGAYAVEKITKGNIKII